MNSSLTTRQEEQVSRFVPAYLVDFKLELFICPDLVRLYINECDQVFLDANSNGLGIRRPADVYILTYGCFMSTQVFIYIANILLTQTSQKDKLF